MDDAQFGTHAILRPFVGFEAVYQGIAGNIPLQFTEVTSGSPSEATDPLAGRPGYSAKLLRGIAVPFGARVQIVLPSLLNTQQSSYTWQLVWRLRGPGDAQASDGRIGFNFPKTANGAPQTVGGVAQPRVLIVASYETILYSATEPAGSGRATDSLRIDTVSPKMDVIPRPFLPDGTQGVYEQGVYDPSSAVPWAAYGGQPSYSSYFTNAKGNELLLGLYRDEDPDWDFTADDAVVAALFGATSASDVGVYLCTGSAP